MVKKIFTILSLFLITFGQAQRLNIGLDIETFFAANAKTVFEEEPFYFLYAAPYSPVSSSSIYKSPFEQVRLARIDGTNFHKSPVFNYKGVVTYQSKNAFRASFAFGFGSYSEKVFYSFQNLVLNDNQNNNTYIFTNVDTPELLDNYISINRFLNTYELALTYDLTNNYKIKPFLLLGFKESIQIYSNYNSKIKSLDINELSDNNVSGYYNNDKFQYDLYRLLSDNGLNHYYTIGIGGRLYSFEAILKFSSSISENSKEFYTNQQIWSIEIKQDLISIPLFN